MAEEMQFLLPTPGEILAAFRDNGDSLARAALNTTEGALLGFLCAIVVSAGLALTLSLSSLVRVSLYPYLMMLQMTPVIIFAPILVLWVGPGLKSVVVITFLICFFPLVVNTTQGLISTDRNLVELFRMYRARRLQALHGTGSLRGHTFKCRTGCCCRHTGDVNVVLDREWHAIQRVALEQRGTVWLCHGNVLQRNELTVDLGMRGNVNPYPGLTVLQHLAMAAHQQRAGVGAIAIRLQPVTNGDGQRAGGGSSRTHGQIGKCACILASM